MCFVFVTTLMIARILTSPSVTVTHQFLPVLRAH
jgi:hypothetical protein